jgi:hypothetical protein
MASRSYTVTCASRGSNRQPLQSLYHRLWRIRQPDTIAPQHSVRRRTGRWQCAPLTRSQASSQLPADWRGVCPVEAGKGGIRRIIDEAQMHRHLGESGSLSSCRVAHTKPFFGSRPSRISSFWTADSSKRLFGRRLKALNRRMPLKTLASLSFGVQNLNAD